jgi:DNA-binding NarL/FixJ family response regulator
MGGHEACQRICCSDSGACVVILTVSDRAEDVGHALEVGASGYLVKADPLQVVAQAIEDATAGLMPLSAPVRSRLVEMWLHRGASLSGASQITLTSREYDIYECLARGLSNREIAQALFLAEGTIKQYVSRLAAKLGVCSRTQILRRMAEFEND